MTDKTFDIRDVKSSDPANLLLANYAFVSTPKKPDEKKDEEYLRQRSDDKIYMSYLDDEPVARVGVIPMTMNVRGTVLPMGGVSGVCSMPAARRGGHVRALMTHSIEQMHADNQPVSTLYPFKTSYYEKFGFSGWQSPMWARINPASLAPYVKLPKDGKLKQRLSADAKDELYALEEATQKTVHGMALHPRVRFDNGVENYPSWFVSLHEGDSITAGISYKMNLDKEVMEVFEIFWHTMNGKLNMLDFMARHVDQVKYISIPLLPGLDPQLWFTDDHDTVLLSNEERSWGAPMGRIVTLDGLNGIAVGDAEATITVNDAQAPWNNGTWTLSGKNGELSVQQGGNAGGEVSIAGLSAMLFSGLDPLTLPHRNWGSVNAETAEALQTLFPPATPYIHEFF